MKQKVYWYKSSLGEGSKQEWDDPLDKYRKRLITIKFPILVMNPCSQEDADYFSIGKSCHDSITLKLKELIEEEGEAYYQGRSLFSMEGDLFPVKWLEGVVKVYEELETKAELEEARYGAKAQAKAQAKAELMPLVNEVLGEHPGRWTLDKHDYLNVHHLDRSFHQWLQFEVLRDKGRPYLEHLIKKLEGERERFNSRREEQTLEWNLINEVKAVLPVEFSCNLYSLEEGVFIGFKDHRLNKSVLVRGPHEVDDAVKQLNQQWEEELKVRTQREALRLAGKPIPKRKVKG